MSSIEIDALIAENNAFWANVFYTVHEDRPGYALYLTPELPEFEFLNGASLVRESDSLDAIEADFDRLGLPPAVWVDPGTAVSPEQLEARGYRAHPDEIEIWRSLRLDRPLAAPESELKVPRDSFELVELEGRTWTDDHDEQLELVLVENDCLTMRPIVREKLAAGSRAFDVRYFVVKDDGRAVASIGMGMRGDRASIVLGATAASHRGQGLFPYLRLVAAHTAKSHGMRSVTSNPVIGNVAAQRGSEKAGYLPSFQRVLWTKAARKSTP